MQSEPVTINLAARSPQTEAEGPGVRFALWVQGCPMRCPGCCNPHFLEDREAERISVDDLAAEILSHRDRIEGVTFIGGEPFSQARGLATLAERVRAEGLSVVVFSGFLLSHLRDERHPDFADRQALLAQTDLLIDGPFMEKLRDTSRRWIGSSNQQIHFLTDRYRHLSDDRWEKESNTLEIRLVDGKITINGYPHADVTQLIRQNLEAHG